MKKSNTKPVDGRVNTPVASDAAPSSSLAAKKTRGRVIFACFAVAILLFALTLGSEIGADLLLPRADKAELTESSYAWGENISTMASGIIRWGETVSKEPFMRPPGQNYLRIKATIPPLKDDSILELFHDNFMLKVQLNGETVYDDGYSKREYSAETRAKIPVPASTAEQKLDIFAYVPFAYRLDISMYPAIRVLSPLGAAMNYAGVFLALLTFVIGLFMSFMSFAISKSPRHIGKLIVLGMSVCVCGVSLLINQLMRHTEFVSDPFWVNFGLFISMFATVCILIDAIICYNRWNKPTVACLILGVVCSLMMLFTEERLSMYALYVVFTLVCTVLTVILLAGFIGIINKKIQYVQLCLTAFLYYSLINLCDSVSFISGMRSYTAYFGVLSVLFFCLVTFVIFYQQALFLAVRKPERDLQIKNDSKWISDITEAVSGIFAQKTPKDFFIASAENLLSLIKNNTYNTAWEEYPYNADYSLPDSDGSVGSCAAMYVEGEGYTEIYNSGDVKCDYAEISERPRTGEQGGLFFSETSLDVLFINDDEAEAVMHFSDISNGLSPQFRNMVSAMYSSMSIAYENLLLKDDMVMTQENVFISLAETVELKNESTTRHLNVVSQITRILCETLGLSPYVSRLVSSASMVHDLGKIAIPESLIDKKGKLTTDEMRVMKQHIVFGYNILSQSHGEFMNAAAIIAQQHHEKYDGTGYIGLSGDDIHLYARIVAVADVFDALSAKRSYKEAWPFNRIIAYINDQSGKHFDPQVVAALNKSIDHITKIEETYSA